MANIADNIIRIYLGVDDTDFTKIEQIRDELKELSYDYFEADYIDENSAEIIMGSKWVAPLDEFQDICNTYGCEIIGVSTEFNNGYVEAFELHSNISVEDTSNHYIAVEAIITDEEITLPIHGDENLLL
jgi:sugar phosphate isomerase/epimerase